MAWMKNHGMIPMERDRVYNWVVEHLDKCYRVCSYDLDSKKLGIAYGHCCFFVSIVWDARTKLFSLMQGSDGVHTRFYEYAHKNKYTEFLVEWIKETPWIPVLVDEAVSDDGVFLNFKWSDHYWSYGCSILESKRESIKNAVEDLEELGGSIHPNKKYVVRSRIEIGGRRTATIREWIPKRS